MSLLPQSINDLRSRTFESLAERLDELPYEKGIVRDFDKATAEALPFLIEEYKLQDFVTGTMSEEMIRRLLKEAETLHKLKGTPAAVKRALAAVGIIAILTEWWEKS